MLSVGRSLVALVYQWLELFYKPMHILLTVRFNKTAVPVVKVHGRIFFKPFVFFVVALHRGNNYLCARKIKIVSKPPASAKSCLAVVKKVVPVEHIHDGVLLLFAVTDRQINVSFPLFVSRKFRYGYAESFNHC